jgi:hypothetical protein
MVTNNSTRHYSTARQAYQENWDNWLKASYPKEYPQYPNWQSSQAIRINAYVASAHVSTVSNPSSIHKQVHKDFSLSQISQLG